MESAMNGDHLSPLSKMATSNGHGENSPYFHGWKAYDSYPYHPTTNPDGVIQMGLAENLLSIDLMREWIERNPKSSICTAEGVSEFKEFSLFQDYHGLPAFRSGVAKFMEKVRGSSQVRPRSFDRDLRWRTGVKLLPVVCESKTDFKSTREALEAAYNKAQEANIKVKGVLITNLSNPLGTVLDGETLRSIVSFINEKNIHLVCDEIYAATVFSKPDFISISEIIIEEDIKCNLDLIHIVYSLSKDLGFPGFRVGVVYSYNDAVVNCARKMSSFSLVSTQTQHLLSAMLSDDQFVENFIRVSAERLALRLKVFIEELAKVKIGCLKSNAWLFCWMDLRALLEEATHEEGKMAPWLTIIDKVKLNVSPGSSFHCSEPGWFRVFFANMDDETMMEAVQIEQQGHNICNDANTNTWYTETRKPKQKQRKQRQGK